jgi:hypothetical protein
MKGRTPWELFDETDAHQALTSAEEAITRAQHVMQELSW